MLRILKIITSVKCVIPLYDGYVRQPKEGELHRKSLRNTTVDKLNQPVWSVDLDKPKGGATYGAVRALQLLWDA